MNFTRGSRHERSRVSGQGNSTQVRSCHAARRALLFGGRGGFRRARAGRKSVGGEGADPCRRPCRGVKVAKSLEEVHEFASKILGMTLITHQTGPQGRLVRRLLVEEGADIAKELYVGMVVD